MFAARGGAVEVDEIAAVEMSRMFARGSSIVVPVLAFKAGRTEEAALKEEVVKSLLTILCDISIELNGIGANKKVSVRWCLMMKEKTDVGWLPYICLPSRQPTANSKVTLFGDGD